MNLALISPRGSFCSHNSAMRAFYDRSGLVLPYRSVWSGLGAGLLTIAGLTPRDWTITLIDENTEPIDFNRHFDVVAISSMTQQATRAYCIADTFRNRGAHVVLGGLHPTVLPDEAKEHADTVVVGEGEYSWPRFIDDFRQGRAQAYYRSEKIVDLRDCPLPRYDLLKGRSLSIVWLQCTRGCPHDCEFCAATKVFGSRFRHKTVDQVVAEVEEVKRVCGDVMIGFADDNAFANPAFAADLLKRLIPLKVRWLAQTDIQVARRPDLLDLASRAGCCHFFIGFESPSRDSLQGIDRDGWKRRQFDAYPESIRQIQSYGIGVMGAFIVGLDNDDLSIFERLEDFIIDNHLLDANVTILSPVPGTRLWERLKNEKRILPGPWENYTGWDVNIIHPRLTKEQLEQGVLRVYERISSDEVRSRKFAFFKEMRREMLKRQAGSELPVQA